MTATVWRRVAETIKRLMTALIEAEVKGRKGNIVERGSRPPAPRDCRYTWVYIFGAVCPARETAAALVPPTVNIEAMTLQDGFPEWRMTGLPVET